MVAGITPNHALKKATFKAIRARPFTKVVGRKVTWKQAEHLIKEMINSYHPLRSMGPNLKKNK